MLPETAFGSLSRRDEIYDGHFIRFQEHSPYCRRHFYFGFGWGNTASSDRLSLTIDVGVLNIGAPQVGITADCINPVVFVCFAINGDVQAEMVELQSDIEDYEWWPVISLGLRFTF